MVSPLNFLLLMKFMIFEDSVVSDIYQAQMVVSDVVIDDLKEEDYLGSLEKICSKTKTIDHSDQDFCTEECLKLYKECEHTDEFLKCVTKVNDENPETKLYLKKCKFVDEVKNKIYESSSISNNKCFIMMTAYRDSWVDAAKNSCYCSLSNAEPCTAEDLGMSPQKTLKELEMSNVCLEPENGGLTKNEKVNSYVSLSNMKKLNCPKPQDRETEEDNEKQQLSIGEMDENELESYCRYGSSHSGNSIGEYRKDKNINPNGSDETNYLGKGYIFCKLKDDRCWYSEFSEWSECTQTCITYDRIPVRYRTRKLLSQEMCQRGKLGTIEFEICPNLEPCERGRWIKNEKQTVDIINYTIKKREDKKKYPQWIMTAIEQYPDILENGKYKENKSKNKYEYKIYKTQKVSTLTQTKCRCPFLRKNVQFAEFIENKKLIEKLTEICGENRENHLVFEGKERYVYYCNIDMVIKDLEYDNLKCEELDNKEYIVCKYNKKIIKTLSVIKTFVVTSVPFIISITILTSSI